MKGLILLAALMANFLLCHALFDDLATRKRRLPGWRRPTFHFNYSQPLYFEQLIDHDHPELGTFKQRWWFNSSTWSPGRPIIFFNAGEDDASIYWRYLTPLRITGNLAAQLGGAVIMIEHRYFGESFPVPNMTTYNMRYMTLENSVRDMVYFVQNVKLPFDPDGTSVYTKAPWGMVGGSYSGMIVATVARLYPGVLWAAYATSALVEAIPSNWPFYYFGTQLGLEAYGRRNCTKDAQLVMAYIDNILFNGTLEEQQQLKEKFGMGGLEYLDDFAESFIYGPDLWQGLTPSSPYDKSSIWYWCDMIENAVEGAFDPVMHPGEEGVGLEKAFDGMAKWVIEQVLPVTCYDVTTGDNSTYECASSHNPDDPAYTDPSLGDAGCSWTWIQCDWPAEWWWDGLPLDSPIQGLTSRYIQPDYWRRICGNYFHTDAETGFTFGLNRNLTVNTMNSYTGGWDKPEADRLIYITGEFDTWRGTSVASPLRPGGPFKSTEKTKSFILPMAVHVWDEITSWPALSPATKEVKDAAFQTMLGWMEEFYLPN